MLGITLKIQIIETNKTFELFNIKICYIPDNITPIERKHKNPQKYTSIYIENWVNI